MTLVVSARAAGRYGGTVAISRDQMIKILADADPVGLIAGGAPKNEYAPEAEAILALQGRPTLTEITTIFGIAFEPGACSRETAHWIADEMIRRDGSR